VIHARMPAEVGALVTAALDHARAELCDDARGEGGPAGPPRTVGATPVDALQLIAESFLAHGPAARNGGDRYQIVVNVDADVVTDDAPGGVCELDSGPASSAHARPGLPVPWVYGDPLDLGHITTALWCVDQRDRRSGN